MKALLSCLAASALVLGASASALAQSRSALDLSALLREEMRAAAQIEDFETAHRMNAAALELQPGHPGLLNNAVLLGAMAGRTDHQFEALETIARAGLSYDLEAAVRNLAQLEAADPERLNAIREALAENAAPVGQAVQVANPALPNALIEALAVDNETERLYLGGVAERRIFRVEPFAPDDFEVFAGEDEPIGSIFGLAADRRHGRLYAVEGMVEQTPLAPGEQPGTALLVLDLETGELIERHTIEGAERMGDLTVRDGVVFVSDADAGRIYRLNGPRAELELYAEDARFASLQGLAQARGALWVVDYALGLWRIDPVSRVAHLQPSPDGTSLIGMDGLVADRLGRLFVVRNGAAPAGVFELVFDTANQLVGLEPVLTGDGRLDEPTTARIADDRLFVNADAPWDQFPADGATPDGPRRSPVILALPIP
ncbi:MAG: hypothetical protein CMH90_08940 [Oceanicaulis sp.]|uniref:hypothetical protein n=1 Tax=Oceanicaulis sp. UBA2681 TaxID=1947007 RepID=UPI000C08E161|nr:hypothetical protein [Oceanicaulis sp. UBA2681]MAP49590.1 hypothetical protein [Oceanicaulis sp.]HCR65429.1 hypothetical protein [Oceanicaulis sp.]|tara:strand:+ start:5278 stop:6567 length:1290 start_codon:yes stop_codon:yes gene_type:complete